MKLIGVLLIFNALVLTAWSVSSGAGNKLLISVCLIAVFAGLGLTFQDRITELTIKGVGTIKAATTQAEAKLGEIEAIRRRVESQSATIDLVAKDAKEARQLTEEIKTKSEDVEKKVQAMDSAVETAKDKSRELSAMLEFTNTVVAAQTDDRKAFDQLKKWAEAKDFPFAKAAAQAWVKVMDDHSKGMYNTGFTVPWNEGVDPTKFDLLTLKKEYAFAHDAIKVPLIEFIWNRADISKRDRLEFLVQILKDDPSLTAVEYAGRYFTQGTELKIKPVATDYLIQWWADHKHEIKD